MVGPPAAMRPYPSASLGTLMDFPVPSPTSKSRASDTSAAPLLTSLPPELLERILTLSASPSLPLTCSLLRAIASGPARRAGWLVARYGRKEALARCWGWGFMRRVVASDAGGKVIGRCACAGRVRVRAKKGDLESGQEKGDNERGDDEEAPVKKVWSRWFRRGWKEVGERRAAVGGVATAVHALVGGCDATPRPGKGKSAHNAEEELDPRVASPCAIERAQARVVACLIELGADVDAGGSMTLRAAA
ncbi:hypothetical protein HK101_004295, partial [Irineochytrium annulatum]